MKMNPWLHNVFPASFEFHGLLTYVAGCGTYARCMYTYAQF